MTLTDLFVGSPSAESHPLTDPLSVGFRVHGLPPPWRRVRAEAVGLMPAVTWIDSSVVTSHPDDFESAGIFASVAVLMGWRLANLGRPLGEVAESFAGLTADVTGWTCRSRIDGPDHMQSASVRLLGTLESPYGPLIANSHTIATRGEKEELIALQLSVTAATRAGPSADQIKLRRSTA